VAFFAATGLRGALALRATTALRGAGALRAADFTGGFAEVTIQISYNDVNRLYRLYYLFVKPP
jgi:hypothetical protein